MASRQDNERPIVQFDDVYKYFDDDKPALRGISLCIERGEFVFITGPSGAGKSTLLKLIYRELLPEEGHIFFNGRDITKLAPKSIPFLRRNIGVVFQDFRLVPDWSVYRNVALPLEILGMSPKAIRSRISVALERVGLEGRGKEDACRLSGGEQQRVAVARAIVAEPALLLADEPTGNLDPHLALDMLTLFEEINASNITVLFATHDHSLLEARQHRLLILEDGTIIEARSSEPVANAGLQVLTN